MNCTTLPVLKTFVTQERCARARCQWNFSLNKSSKLLQNCPCQFCHGLKVMYMWAVMLQWLSTISTNTRLVACHVQVNVVGRKTILRLVHFKNWERIKSSSKFLWSLAKVNGKVFCLKYIILKLLTNICTCIAFISLLFIPLHAKL